MVKVSKCRWTYVAQFENLHFALDHLINKSKFSLGNLDHFLYQSTTNLVFNLGNPNVNFVSTSARPR